MLRKVVKNSILQVLNIICYRISKQYPRIIFSIIFCRILFEICLEKDRLYKDRWAVIKNSKISNIAKDSKDIYRVFKKFAYIINVMVFIEPCDGSKFK